jgi:Putative Ig domain
MPPYTWAVNGLPEGLDIDPAGQITGAARVPGPYLFTVRVTDSARASVTELFRLEVSAPSVPALRVSGLPDVSKAADQATFRLELAAPYTLPISGQLSISFAADTGTGDPAVQFSTGGRTLDFQIPAGTTAAQLPTSSVGLQTGTVAGTITMLLRMQTPGADLTPTPVTLQSIRVERSAPVITSASFSRTSSGIEIRITGYSTAREITQGVFRFTAAPGNSLSTSELTLPLEEPFGRWFRDAESSQYGGQFTFAQQFTVQGQASAVTPVSITLTNRIGSTTLDIR